MGCQRCADSGWIKDATLNPGDRGFGLFQECPVCHGQVRKQADQIALMQHFAPLIQRYSALRGTLRRCDFRGFQTSDLTSQSYNAVVRWATRTATPWLYLYGPVGNGKTHLAAAAANLLLAEEQAVLFVTGPNLLALIRNGFDTGESEALIGLCQRVPVLIVDDLGAERVTEWAAEVLFRVFDTRYVEERLTLAVSNGAPAAFPEARLASRFQDRAVCEVVGNNAPDYRPQRLPTARSVTAHELAYDYPVG